MRSLSTIASSRIAAILGALLLVLGQPAFAQKDEAFQPHIGQAGKDVIWVPSPDDVVERMLTMAQVTANDYVIDLGSGDGKIAIAAAKKFGARSLGIEYNPDMVRLSQRNAQVAGVEARTSFRQADIFSTDFTQATVITMYLLPGLNLKLRPQILGMRPGTRIASHSFSMDDWEADEVSVVDGKRAYFWVVPAQVGGEWTLDATVSGRKSRKELFFEQKFQVISGTLTTGPLQAGLRDPRLNGFRIAFTAVDENRIRHDYAGRVEGRRMEGSVKLEDGTEGRWIATRK